MLRTLASIEEVDMKLKTVITTIAFAALLQSCQQDIETEAVFSYDMERITDAKPWTGKQFQNDPAEFQFAIIGDRTGGANVQDTFKLAMGQLNLLQPEFVINVGDMIEGYTRNKERNGFVLTQTGTPADKHLKNLS